jgi:hypothetical protein
MQFGLRQVKSFLRKVSVGAGMGDGKLKSRACELPWPEACEIHFRHPFVARAHQ